MTSPLAHILHQHLRRSLYSQGQLAALSGVPKNTITNWLSGRVSKPHQWQGLIRVATALRLTATETDTLLRAGGQPTLAELRHITRTQHSDLLAPWSATAPPPFQALPDLPYFVGRETELKTLRMLLLKGKQICLYGMGGVGKTALATHLAYQLQPEFPDGVLWARLDTSDTMAILHTFAGSYGVDVSQAPTLDSRATLVRGLLAHKRALLILDNAEESGQIASVLPPTTGNCAVLVTTRFDLSITDGWPRLEVKPFELDSAESLALFRHFLGFSVIQKHQSALREMANLVGQLPLALAILAARLGQAPGQEITPILTHLRQTYNRLEQLEREQRSVRTTFDVTFLALPPELQQFFIQLGVFGGEDFTIQAAAFVTQTQGEASNYLNQLRVRSFIQESWTERYRLHPLLRDYAREKLRTTPDPTAPAIRMIRYYIEAVEALTTQEQSFFSISPARLQPDLSNLIAALDTACEPGLEAYLPRVLMAFFDILYQEGLASLLEKYLPRAIAWTQTHHEPTQQAKMLTLFGRVQYWQGRDPLPHYQTALNLARQVEDELTICDTLRHLAGHAWRHNEFEESKTFVLEALEIARRLSPSHMIELLINLGAIASVQKQYQEAEGHYRESLELARKIGYHRAQMVILQNLACLLADQGHYPQAVSYFEQGLQLGREHGLREALMGLLGDWGYRAMRHKDLSHAEAYCQESLALAQEMGHLARIATRLSDLGEMARLQGKNQAALRFQEEALGIVENGAYTPVKPLVLLRLANLYADLGQLKQAEEFLRQCLAERAFLHAEFEGELSETQQRFSFVC
ncbi:MAG: hypothetical protein Fur0022_17410 [Anaerolineales bacterium]